MLGGETGRIAPLKNPSIYKTYIFFPALEFRRKLFFAYLLPLLHAIAYFAFFC